MKNIVLAVGSLMLLAGCMTLPTSAEYAARGDGYFKDGRADKAITAYNKAIVMNPDNLEAYASRGAVHFFSGHYDLAQQDFEHVLTVNPYHADTYTAYGSVLAARGDFENARKVLDMAVRLNPSKPENFFSRAGVYFMLGQYQQAVNDYSAVLSLYPAADVYNARGAAYLRMGKDDLAEQDFKAAQSGKMPQSLNIYSMIK